MNQLLGHLPAIYREGLPDGQQASHFLALFLRAFERVLLDGEDDKSSLQQEITAISQLFDAQNTPEEFLDWLSDWVALSLHHRLSVQKRRRLLARIANLYRIRGTRIYLEELLRLHLDVLASASDTDFPDFQIATHSTIGEDTYLGGGPPFLFQVTLAFPNRNPVFVEQQLRLARDVVEKEKPAHAWYKLNAIFPRFRLGVHSTLGVDTVLAKPA